MKPVSTAPPDTLVCDMGSHRVKCGLASAALTETPGQAVAPVTSRSADGVVAARPPFGIPAVVGRERVARGLFGAAIDEVASLAPQKRWDGVYVGVDCHPASPYSAQPRGLLKLSYPIQNSLIVDPEAGYALLKQGINASLIPNYWSVKTQWQHPSSDGHGRDGSSCSTGGGGAKGVVGGLEQQERAEAERRRQQRVLRQLDNAGDDGDAPRGGLFASYRAVTCTGTTGSSGGKGRWAGPSSGQDGDSDVLTSFPQLRVATPQSYNAVLVEPPFSSRRQRALLVELLFEANQSTLPSRGTKAEENEECDTPAVIQGLLSGVAPLFALYGTGQSTGVVLDVGHHVVSTACALNGRALTCAMQRSDGVCGGDAVTDHLRSLMQVYRVDHDPSPSLFGSGTSAEKELLSRIKEQCCEVLPGNVFSSATAPSSPPPSSRLSRPGDTQPWLSSSSPGGGPNGGYPSSAVAHAYGRRRAALAELDAAIAQHTRLHRHLSHQSEADGDAGVVPFTLPDGSVVGVPVEAALRAPEAHFTPAVMGHGEDVAGVVDLLSSTIAHPAFADHRELRPALLSNVVLSGGATLTRGFASRLLSELQARTAGGVRVRVTAPQERGVGAWLGAAFLAQLSTFPGMCVSRAAYFEEGESALQARLFS